MKATVIIGIIAAALGGALLATVLADDEAAEVVTVERSAGEGTAPPDTAAEQPRERSSPHRLSSRQARYIDPEDRPIRRAELDRVRDAALRAVGGGTVTDIDRSDDLGSAYEVEVVQSGLEIDTRLDRDLNTVETDYDD